MSTFFVYIHCVCLFRMSQLTRDERSDNDEEDEEGSSLTDDEGAQQHKLGNGLAVDEKTKNVSTIELQSA